MNFRNLFVDHGSTATASSTAGRLVDTSDGKAAPPLSDWAGGATSTTPARTEPAPPENGSDQEGPALLGEGRSRNLRILLAIAFVGTLASGAVIVASRINIFLGGTLLAALLAIRLWTVRRYLARRLTAEAALWRAESALRVQERETALAAERAHRQAAQFNRDVLDSLSTSIAVLDQEGRLVVVNEAWGRAAAQRAAGLIAGALGANYLAACARAADRVGNELASQVQKGIREVLSGTRADFEVEYLGGVVTQQLRFRLQVRPLAAIGRGVVLAHEDITAGHAVQEKLRLFRNLVDQSNDTIEVIDPDTGRFLDVNAKGPADLGYTREEYLARHVFDIDKSIPPEGWSNIVDRMRSAGFVSGEGTHQRKDGSDFPIEFNAKVVRLDRDYVVTVVRDITDRRRAEQRVREQAAMLDLARDAIIVRRFSDHMITFWNKGAERIYGWTPAEAIGQCGGDFISIDPAKFEEVASALLEHEEWRGEIAQRTKGGRCLTVSTRATLVRDAHGTPQSVLLINTDVTEQKELETRFLRAQRMQSIGTLASGIAHDLNNILCPILMTAPMLRRNLPSESQEEIVSNIITSARRGSEIVKQVLAFGRGLRGERRPLAVASVIEESLQIVAETFPKQIEVQRAFPANLWSVVGDATQLQQVVINLCVNARDAMPEGGVLRVTVTNLELSAQDATRLPGATPGPNVLVEVSDSGIGIAQEMQEQIFEPFFTTKPHGKGTGLGLSTVLGIVQGHGGHIGVTSEPQRGSTFRLHLPAVPALACRDEGSKDVALPIGAGECVLIVDDEAQVRESARLVLELYGYRTLLAGDGVEALAVLAERRDSVAVLLTDLMMPNMDGLALIRAVAQVAPHLPIVPSTGLETPRYVDELALFQTSPLLIKPYAPESLLHAISGALSSPVRALAAQVE
jgi:PAS domain S-box-containing protein